MWQVAKHCKIALLILSFVCSFARASEPTVAVTEYHHGLSPKYFSVLVDQPHTFLPSYIETPTSYDSMHDYYIYHSTRSLGFMNAFCRFVRWSCLTEGKEKNLKLADLFAIFKKHKRFTYVITDHEWIFTRTANRPWIAMKSKHIVLANLSPKVRSAGELYLSEKDGVKTLVVENSSGSYNPRPQNLTGVVQLLRSLLATDEQAGFAVKMHPLFFVDDADKLDFYARHAADIL